jgi:fused signal recognition particle receptor
LFDVAPPEDDKEAKQLSKKIKEWINQGKPSTIKNVKDEPEEEFKEQSEEDDEQKPDKEESKPKKKRGRFGLFRK